MRAGVCFRETEDLETRRDWRVFVVCRPRCSGCCPERQRRTTMHGRFVKYGLVVALTVALFGAGG